MMVREGKGSTGTRSELELTPLVGTNPLAFLAALGALDVAARALPRCLPTLRWTDRLVPRAVLSGPDSIEHLVALADADRDRWAVSPVLTWGPDGVPLDDLKPTPTQLREWAEATRESLGRSRADADLFSALVAEGAVAGKGDTKPTHLHFTAGQQRFLRGVRQLQNEVSAADLEEALRGPWRYSSELPVLRWDAKGERIYALRGTNPAKEKPTGVPGADWLGFLGLTFLPVVATATGRLLTAGCAPRWKGGSFTWPLWSVPLGPEVVRSLLGDSSLAFRRPAERAALGVLRVLRAPIRRADTGGYGSFGPAEEILDGKRVGGDGRRPHRTSLATG